MGVVAHRLIVVIISEQERENPFSRFGLFKPRRRRQWTRDQELFAERPPFPFLGNLMLLIDEKILIERAFGPGWKSGKMAAPNRFFSPKYRTAGNGCFRKETRGAS
ncbi:hypothetical protein D1872_291000 [compost metagenome]